MQERIDCVQINSVFQLNEAISSLRFWFNVARKKGVILSYELWTEKGAIIPSEEVHHCQKECTSVSVPGTE